MDHSCHGEEKKAKGMDVNPDSEREAENIIDPMENNSLPSIEDDEGDKEEPGVVTRNFYLQIPYGFQSRGSYKHASKNCEIVGVTYNSRFRQFVFLDSRGITSWSFESVYSTVTRHLNYPSYQFNVLRLITFSRKFNVYFALSKEYALKVFNLNFHEVFSVAAEMHSVLCMVFNHGRDELITGGTGGMKFWTFGEIDKDRQKAWEKDSRPMANYGLVLRASYPDMAGSWVKHVELDEAMQRLYCLSERNVLAYDMEGNLLFEILDAHRGPVTGCVYSKASNFLVTVGNDCDVNVWSSAKNGGKVHTFTGHSKAIIKIILHPESSALVITAAMDGIVKVHSLDIMEEIYSLPVFSEGIYWMDTVSTKLIYCCSNRVIEVFSLNHLTDFWALTRCSVTSLSLVTCSGKSTRVMVVGNDSSVRLFSRKRQNLSTVLPPPSISPLNMVKDVAYSRDLNMMYLLINEEEIWVYYTRTNPATRVESWPLEYIEDIHGQHSQVASLGSKTSSPWPGDGDRSPSPFVGNSLSPDRRSLSSRDASGRESMRVRGERVQLLCLGMLYSPIILQSIEGEACPDATQFLMAGTQDGRVLFLHMFCKGLLFHQMQANKDAVLGLYHDQGTNTLVTKCRHPGIAILIWSLPYLELLIRVDCEVDLTCFTRMNNLLLCGHNSGYLQIHSLAKDKCFESQQTGEVVAEVTRHLPKDHQDRVNSVDANSSLEVFCSASRDGVVKLWDKGKTLLCEITMDETLTVAAFLNSQGDILVGFKRHIFVISRWKVYPVKELGPSTDEADLINDEAFETESDVYEDPSVRYESKKILQPDPANMENYLVPFPNLQLKTSWFMEGRSPPDLEQQNRQDEEESLSLLSDNLSLAPTEVYCSPSATPRSLSLASFEPLSECKGNTELWELPECGSSPVSSPPRTPPPEPTPPSTPPPGEESEDEETEGGANTLEELQQENGPSRVEFVEPAKKDAKKKTFVPSFRREGGRLGNISIDSRSLRMRSGDEGPGYAAPVSRKIAVQNPEPKPFKPRRIPKAVVKKFKNPKEKGKEETEKETDEEQEKLDAEEQLREKGQDDDNDDATQAREVIDPSSRTANRINLPSGLHKPLIRQDTGSTRHEVVASLVSQGHDSAHSTEVEERLPRKDARGTEAIKTPHKTGIPSEVSISEGSSLANNRFADSGIEIVTTGQVKLSKNAGEGTQEAVKQVEQAKAVWGSSLDPSAPPLVTYIDPDTGEIVQKPANEIPKGAEILDEHNDEEDVPGGDENHSCLSSVRHVSKSEHGGKGVTFAEDEKKPNLSPRHKKSLPEFYYNSGRNSPFSRPFSLGAVPKDAVLPIYSNTRPGDPRSKGSDNDSSISPLTIFALARNRKRNNVKAGKARSDSAKYLDRDANQKPDVSDISSSRIDGKSVIDLELNGEELASLIDKLGSPTPEIERTVSGALKPTRVRKQESTLMRWCIRALQKRDRNVMFPPRPSRPSSSPSSSSSKPTKKDVGTLYLNVTQSIARPKTADTIRSTDTSHEEYSLFPYKSTPVLDEVSARPKSRDQRSAAGLKVNTRTLESRYEDEDLMDAYRAMRSSIGLHVESDEDCMKDFKAVLPDENESSTDLPVLETNDYAGQWQNKVLERARVLKQRRLERQKTATERRRVLETEQKERWKNSSHFEYAQESPTKSETAIEFITSPLPSPVRTATPIPSQEQTHIRNLKDQELTSDRPYRLRMNPQPAGACLTPVAKSLLNLKSSDHHVSEIAHVLPKPAPSASIPSKCSRYILVPQPVPKQDQPVATTMEETLLLLRFPKSRVRRRHTDIPRPHSNPNVRLETK